MLKSKLGSFGILIGFCFTDLLSGIGRTKTFSGFPFISKTNAVTDGLYSSFSTGTFLLGIFILTYPPDGKLIDGIGMFGNGILIGGVFIGGIGVFSPDTSFCIVTCSSFCSIFCGVILTISVFIG
jgi:hypothetical protein